MPNTMSTKKALRSSLRKRTHNLFWKKKVKEALKVIKDSLLTKEVEATTLSGHLHSLQKALDKASKEKVIHKGKANRLKSIYAKKIAGLATSPTSKRKSKSTK